MLYVLGGLACVLVILSFFGLDEIELALGALLGDDAQGQSGQWLLMTLLLAVVVGVVVWRRRRVRHRAGKS